MALGAKDSNLTFIFLAYLPAIAFWFLDGYFLWQEKLFRALYDFVRILSEDKIDFSMDTSIVKNKVEGWSDITLSNTLILFHGIILFSIIVIMLFFIIK